jgi:hypothetical protein
MPAIQAGKPHVAVAWDVKGVRTVSGRFESMRVGGVVRIAEERGRALEAQLTDLYRSRAPRSPAGPWIGRTISGMTERSHGRFADTFKGKVSTTALGFSVEVSTTNPYLRSLLKYGTGQYAEFDPGSGRMHIGQGPGGAIVPVRAKVLTWQDMDGVDHFAMQVRGMRPNRWEETTYLEAKALAVVQGNLMGHAIRDGLKGRGAFGAATLE